jgi:hypothetical protein
MWLFEVTVKEDARPIGEAVISEFGKLSVFLARHNTRVAAIPISFLSKCADLANQDDLLWRCALTLSETTKQLIAYSRERNEPCKDLIMIAFATLEQVVKAIFKKNRDVDVVLLMQPFAEIAEFIGQDNMKNFPDRDAIINEIRRVLNEFQALQVVTKNVETIAPHVAEDSTSTYSQDMPY